AAPGAPSQVSVLANFLCDECTNIWIWWQPPVEGSTDILDYIVEDGPGNVVCTIPVGSWNICLLSGLRSGSTHDLVVRGRNAYGIGTGVPVAVTLN
ncbi:MAG: fibronectin type III domain-containing protein, partial [Actinomycetota bacterium]